MTATIDALNNINFTGTADESLPNDNVFITGKTGSGKSTVLRMLMAKNPERVVLWDPDRTHLDPKRPNDARCWLSDHGAFARELSAAMASGQRFRLALSVANQPESFQYFCACLVSLASAERPITVVVEEVQQVTGNAQPVGAWATLQDRGRKYGVRLLVVSPRASRCDKTIVSNCEHRYVCKLGQHPDRERMAKELGSGITATDVEKMGKLNEPRSKIHWFYAGPDADAALFCHDFKNGVTTELPPL